MLKEIFNLFLLILWFKKGYFILNLFMIIEFDYFCLVRMKMRDILGNR